ncbi:MAG: DUF4358 domain-containing protein [Clostridia bacterium]|nr:DUF4358 domain-containing protein [Clostridia bacterium]
MKKIIALTLVIVAIFCLASCGSEDAAANRLETTSEKLLGELSGKIDLSDLDLLTETNPEAKTLLMYVYGIDEELISSVDSFFITNSHRSTDARAIVVLFMKEEGAKENIAKAKTALNDIFLKQLITTTATYDAEQAKIANSATFTEYDNALVFISYNTEGNTAVISAIEGK